MSTRQNIDGTTDNHFEIGIGGPQFIETSAKQLTLTQKDGVTPGKMKAIALRAQTTKTSNYTVTENDDSISGDCTSGSVTLTLPAIAGVIGQHFSFTKVDSSANLLNVASSDTIVGLTFPLIINKQGMSITIFAGASAWEMK